jgi:hypothetical protein
MAQFMTKHISKGASLYKLMQRHGQRKGQEARGRGWNASIASVSMFKPDLCVCGAGAAGGGEEEGGDGAVAGVGGVLVQRHLRRG